MSTIVGIIIGVVSTIIVGHYYFKRTIKKSIAIYLTLSSRIFAGIEPSVREQLKFLFRDSEVRDLSQVEFIVANDGERAIRDCIEPLSLELPEAIEILDASILYRNPPELVADVERNTLTPNRTTLNFDFPLLNKGDFFLVKLLLNGRVNPHKFEFHIVADDLPRTVKPKQLPPQSTKDAKPRVEWAGIGVGSVFIILALFQGYGMFYLEELFRGSWNPREPSFWVSTSLLLWLIVNIVILLIGILLFVGIGFEEFYRRYPRFPLPSEFRRRGHPLIIHGVENNELIFIEDSETDKERPKGK